MGFFIKTVLLFDHIRKLKKYQHIVVSTAPFLGPHKLTFSPRAYTEAVGPAETTMGK